MHLYDESMGKMYTVRMSRVAYMLIYGYKLHRLMMFTVRFRCK